MQHQKLKSFKEVLILFAMVCYGFSGFAQQQGIFQKEGLAIRGYDPVAYFRQNEAIKGSESFSWDWQGVRWLFMNESNRTAFKTNPEKYSPQFGGFCAYGASEGHLSPTDPNAWTIVGDKLYLNFSPKVKTLWLPDTTSRIPQAVNYWKTLPSKN